MGDIANSLPPGWDYKWDSRTNRYYFLNHFTRMTTWEDPRMRYRQIHGTPTNVPTMPGENIQMQELNSISRMSPMMNRASQPGNYRGSPSVTRVQESSLTTVVDTEQSVAKISTMFPTVSEMHIRLLLKKYMKSIFPKVEETVLLDVLGNNENNVQKASEALKEMGFERVESKPIIKASSSAKHGKPKVTDIKPVEVIVPKITTLQEKNEMKSKLQSKYEDIPEQVITIALESVNYDENRAAQILDIMVKEEVTTKNAKQSSPRKKESQIREIGTTSTSETLQIPKTSIMTPSPSEHILQGDKLDVGKARRTKEKINSFRNIQEKVSTHESGYTSSYLCSTSGPNPTLVKGASDGMLLEDYMTWDGPDPSLRQGIRGLAKGSDSSLLSKRTHDTIGPTSSLCKGPALGLAKGSIYSQLKGTVVGESRGK